MILLVPALAGAHYLWVVPGKYHLAAGERTRVFITNGDVFPESRTLLGEHRVTAMELIGADRRDVVSKFRVDGNSLTFEIPQLARGDYALALATRSRRVRLQPEEFNQYLEEEGLTHVLDLREETGESKEPVLERYAKYAKAYIRVGGAGLRVSEGIWGEPVGHAIEIVPESNPNRLTAGAGLDFRVLYESEPLAGVTVFGARAGNGDEILRTVTDSSGRASVRLREAGRWYLRVVHMIRIEADPDVRWESFWCTLTFEVREREEVP